MKSPAPEPQVLTIGHSTRPIEEFAAILKNHAIEGLVDVRTIPRSRYNPQFNHDALAGSMASAGIGYMHMKDLGGLRHARADSPNAGWRNDSFRGYADYMQTPEFQAALTKLIETARQERVAIMCAEAVPWRCHRSLIADALTVRGIAVQHIMGIDKIQPHKLTSFAVTEGDRIIYPRAD